MFGMRVTTELFVSALLRRVNSAGGMAVLGRKGTAEAGAVFIKFRHGDGRYDLLAPAPQAVYGGEGEEGERAFQMVATNADEMDVDARIGRERNWDPDLWIIEIEDCRQPPDVLVRLVSP